MPKQQPFSKLRPHQKKKFTRVMREYASGSLRSSSGAKVTSREQALAIAFDSARRA